MRVMTHEKGNSNAWKAHFWLQHCTSERKISILDRDSITQPVYHLATFPCRRVGLHLPACYVRASFFFLPRERIWKRDAAVAERREEGKCESAIHHGPRRKKKLPLFAFLASPPELKADIHK